MDTNDVIESEKHLFRSITLDQVKDYQAFFGCFDEHLKILEKTFSVSIAAHGSKVTITGTKENVCNAEQVLKSLESVSSEGYEISRNEFQTAIQNVRDASSLSEVKNLFLSGTIISTPKRKVFPKTPMQKRYLDAMAMKDLVFSIGPAGTGKTYLAVAMAVSYLLAKKVSRIILARPAVEAGESLGFLPGDMYEKINPYLRPLYDALYDLLEIERANRLVEKGVIEIAPIAFMRGRTLNDSFIIMDEAQNSTAEQMKMFLTRLGFNTKTVVTGDISQIDLKSGKISGLVQVQNILKGVNGVEFIYLTHRDVVRCQLVRDIVEAYDKFQTESL
jgi:phosphate starvation-inducible protein PhoH and related proteins